MRNVISFTNQKSQQDNIPDDFESDSSKFEMDDFEIFDD